MIQISGRMCIAIFLLACLTGTSAAGQAESEPGQYPDEISAAQAKDKKEAGAFILDVREPGEWSRAHIPGAALIPLGLLTKRLKELPQDKEIIVVCGVGGRSATGRDILRKVGYKRVTSMAGGMKAWQAAGYPTESGW